MKIAIIWPANPNAGPDMHPDEANVELHIALLKTQKAIYWDSGAIRNEIGEPIDGFIYIAGEGLVKYRCKVEHVIKRETLLEMPDELKYVPPFRNQCLRGRWPDGRKHGVSPTWIKISGIYRLRKPLTLRELINRNERRVKRVMGGFVYIENPFLIS